MISKASIIGNFCFILLLATSSAGVPHGAHRQMREPNHDASSPLSNLFLKQAAQDQDTDQVVITFSVDLECQGHQIRGHVPVDGLTRVISMKDVESAGIGNETETSSGATFYELLDKETVRELLGSCSDVNDDDYHRPDDFSITGDDTLEENSEAPFFFFSFKGTGAEVDFNLCPLPILENLPLVKGVAVFQLEEAFCHDPDYFWWQCESWMHKPHHGEHESDRRSCHQTRLFTLDEATYVVAAYFDASVAPSRISVATTLSRTLECSDAEEMAVDGSVLVLGVPNDSALRSTASRWATCQGTGTNVTTSACHPETTAHTGWRPRHAQKQPHFVSVYRGSCEDELLKPALPVFPYNRHDLLHLDGPECNLRMYLPTEMGATYYIRTDAMHMGFLRSPCPLGRQ